MIRMISQSYHMTPQSERWNGFHSSELCNDAFAKAERGLPRFAEHLAVVCEPASDWGPSVGMHSTGVKLFSVPVCGPQNDGFRPHIRQLGRISFGNLAGFHSAT